MTLTHTPMSPKEALPKIEALIQEGISCPVVVTGNSMRPFLRSGEDTVIVSPVTGKIKRGDILLYRRCGFRTTVSSSPGSPNENPVPILHRVHNVRSDYYLMVGDAQVKKEPVPTDRVIGVVTQVLKKSKRIPVTDGFLRFKVFLWQLIRPLRPLILRFLR